MTTYANPGPIDDVPPSPNKIEATWGNAVRDRLVNNFEDDTERDAAIPTPVQGQACCVAGKFQVWNGDVAGWGPPWDTAWGIVGDPVEVTADQAIDDTEGDVGGGASVTWTATAGRRYKHTVSCAVSLDTVGGVVAIKIATTGNAILKTARAVIVDTGEAQSLDFVWYEDGLTAGSKTRKLRQATSSGTLGNIESATWPLQYFVEDVGAAADPA